MPESSEIPQVETESREPSLKEKEISGVWEAIQLADRTARDKKSPIGEDLVLGLHSKVMKHFPRSNPGQYRRRQVAISGAVLLPPEWKLVPREMKNFGYQLDDRAASLDSSLGGIEKVVEAAAWAHFQISRIHPFEDGNGRVARLVADTISKRAGLYYITDWAANIDRYLDSLKRVSTTGDYSYFEEFIAERLVARYDQVEGDLKKSSISRAAHKTSIFTDLKDRRSELAKIVKSKGNHKVIS